MIEELWKNSAIIAKRNVDSNQTPISVNLTELKQIIDVHSCLVLNQLPDEHYGINIDEFTEVYDIEDVTTKSYKVDYANGVLYFHPNNIGKVIQVNYYGIGCTLLSASRIYTKYDKYGNVLETLEELIDKGKLYIQAIESLGGAVEVINRLENANSTGTILHENLLEDIRVGTPLNTNLKENIQEGNTLLPNLVDANNAATQKKKDLDQSIVNATDTNTTLSNTNQSATQTNLVLQQTIASGKDSVDKINATGNKSLIIGASQFVNNEYTWKHDMNSEDLHVTFEDLATKLPLLPDYQRIDKNNILIRNSVEHPNIKVVLSASYYQGNALFGTNVEEFEGDSIVVGAKKVRLKDGNGTVENPITDSDAVFMSDGTTKLTKAINDIYKKFKNNKVINILDCGAVGDGITDNTKVFLDLFSSIENNTTIKIPTGEYIVYKDFDGVESGDSKLLSECITLKGLKNITIEGDGDVLIRPNKQNTSQSKKRYPCTISIDMCENVIIKNLKIESKGENYGDSDSGHTVTQGDNRANFIIKNGGSAIFVTRSKKIVIDSVEARLCGSCAVIYHSNISDCIVQNTLANPLSLGYAGFTVDTFVTNDNTFNNKILYKNCKSYAEEVIRENKVVGQIKYNSKCGILLEGDTRLVDAKIVDCEIKDSYSNNLDKYLGSGIVTANSITFINNCYFENCANLAYKRDLLTSNGSLIIKNCTAKKMRTHGIVIRDLYSLMNLKDIILDNNKIEVTGEVIYPNDDAHYLRESGGIVIGEYRNTSKILCNNNIIISPFNTIFQIARCDLILNHNTLISKSTTVNLKGGGSIELFSNSIRRQGYVDDTANVILNTQSVDGANSIYEITINNNEFIADNKTHQAIQIISSNPSDLILLKNSSNNSFTNCCVNRDKTNIDLKLENKDVFLLSKGDMVGSYTVLKFDFSNNIGTTNDYKLISDDNTIYSLIKQGREIRDNNYIEIFYINGDVRSKFTVGKKYTLL